MSRSPGFRTLLADDDLVRRIGVAVSEYGIPFPPLADDPGELWLVAEAVMARYHSMRAEHERTQAAVARAAATARQLVDEHRAAQGLD